MREDRTGLPLAIVVGGSGGMGQACARRLGHHHAVILANRDVAKTEEVADELRREGCVAIPLACDVSDAASVAEMARKSAAYGPVKTLAHVVGLSPSSGEWARIFTVNLLGAANVAEAVLPLMAPGGAGIFVSSLAAHRVRPDDAMLEVLDDPLAPDLLGRFVAQLGHEPAAVDAYRYSKHGLNRMVRRLVTRWGERRARIVSLSPGQIMTPMGDRESETTPAKRAIAGRTPLGRQGTLTEICDALEFLASERASFLTGTDLLVDGGLASALEFDLPPPRSGSGAGQSGS